MNSVDLLLPRNAAFVAERFEVLPPIPASRMLVLTCADSRVDPAHILGLRLGEAAVIRNVGGRVTPAVVEMLAMLALVGAAEGATDGWELVLIQHTDCGITRLTDFAELLAESFGVATAELGAKCVSDPHAAVAADIAALAANPVFPDALVVSGLVYDVAGGRVKTVVPAQALRELRDGRSDLN